MKLRILFLGIGTGIVVTACGTATTPLPAPALDSHPRTVHADVRPLLAEPHPTALASPVVVAHPAPKITPKPTPPRHSSPQCAANQPPPGVPFCSQNQIQQEVQDYLASHPGMCEFGTMGAVAPCNSGPGGYRP